MATSAAMRAFTWGDGVQVAAQDLRLGQISALLSALGGSSTNPLGIGSGVRHGVGSPLFVGVSSGLSVTVNTGFAVVQGSAAANSGAYACTLDSTATLTCATADLVNPRIDSVIVQVVDNGNNTSTATVNIQTGTPASSPSPPTLPANSLLLCNITVNANATSLTSGNLSDQRTFLAAAGGIQPVLSSAFYPTAGPHSAYAHDLSTDRLKRFTGTALAAPLVAPWAPVYQSTTNPVTSSSTSRTQVLAGTVTVDGSTPVKISASWPFCNVNTGAVGATFYALLFRDAVQLKPFAMLRSQTAAVALDGRTVATWDYTPSAGTHTYYLYISCFAAGTSFTMEAGSGQPIELMIEAVSV